MRKLTPRRKKADRRKTTSTAWVLGGALAGERRVGPRDRRTRLKDRRHRI
ncbi:MAG TPA: hypothetical protein VF950_08650 [Planctomycetota bacterium]